MKYGHFSSDGKEYIITNPDTPRPWFNYLFNGCYHALVSQTGGGYSYFMDPKYYRILRYDHIHTDRPGRYLFIRDDKTGEVWTPNWQPSELAGVSEIDVDEYFAPVTGAPDFG